MEGSIYVYCFDWDFSGSVHRHGFAEKADLVAVVSDFYGDGDGAAFYPGRR